MLFLPCTWLHTCKSSATSSLHVGESPVCCNVSSSCVVSIKFSATNSFLRQILNSWISRLTWSLTCLKTSSVASLHCAESCSYLPDSGLCDSTVCCGKLYITSSYLFNDKTLVLLSPSTPMGFFTSVFFPWIFCNVVWHAFSPPSTLLHILMSTIRRTCQRVSLILLVIFRR